MRHHTFLICLSVASSLGACSTEKAAPGQPVDSSVPAEASDTGLDAAAESLDASAESVDALVDGNDEGPDFSISDRSTPPDVEQAESGDEAKGDRSSTDADGTDGALKGPFRLLAPLSTATVTSKRPTLRWLLGDGSDGASVQVCRDRACSLVVAEADVDGDRWVPVSDLTDGPHFWRAYPRTGDVKGRTPTAVWQFFAGTRSAPVDSSWGSTLDVDGDGYADVVIGAAYDGSGRAYLYRGRLTGLPVAPDSTVANPDDFEAAFGIAVASAGDVNGDGYADVVIGAPAADANAGRAYLYFGGRSGLASQPSIVLRRPQGDGNQFGGSVAGAGDVNGDGYADVLVGAGSAVGSSSFSGRAYLYFGSSSGPALAPDVTLISPDGPGTYFGSSLAGAGDVNGDGLADVVIGAFGTNALAGRAYVYLGSRTGPSKTPSHSLAGSDESGASFGVSVACAGDVNGDGYSDIAIGAAALTGGKDGRDLPGRVYVHLGGASGISTIPGSTLIGRASERFGASVASAGDVNGDGFSDLVIGAPAGVMANVYLGEEGGFFLGSEIVFTAPNDFYRESGFGTSVAGAGDTNGDGLSDIVIGAPRALSTYVFMGRPSGPARNPQLEIRGPGDQFSAFGISVASRANFRARSRLQ